MGEIGIRCANLRTSLWFHVSFAFATDHLYPPFRVDGSDPIALSLAGGRYPWTELTPEGKLITARILELPGFTELAARPDYFDLGVDSEERWRIVLPAVVNIIRDVSNDPTAPVVIRRDPAHPDMPQWHAPLVDEFFGS